MPQSTFLDRYGQDGAITGKLNLAFCHAALYPVFLLLVLTLSPAKPRKPYLHSVNSNVVEMASCPSVCSQISKEHGVQSHTFKNKTQESVGQNLSSISSTPDKSLDSVFRPRGKT